MILKRLLERRSLLAGCCLEWTMARLRSAAKAKGGQVRWISHTPHTHPVMNINFGYRYGWLVVVVLLAGCGVVRDLQNWIYGNHCVR